VAPLASVANILSDAKKQQVIALGQLGWTLRRIEEATGVRRETASTLMTSNRPAEDWGKLLGDVAAVTALLDRLLNHAHVLTCGPKSRQTRLQLQRYQAPRLRGSCAWACTHTLAVQTL